MTAHFLPRKRRWGQERRTRSMVKEGKVFRSRADYYLGTNQSFFRNVSIRDPQHNTDRFMVVGCLRSAPEREHTRYISGRRKLPSQPPTEPTREDRIFAALRRAVPRVNLRGDVEARRQESLRAKGDGSSSKDLEAGPRYKGEPPIDHHHFLRWRPSDNTG